MTTGPGDGTTVTATGDVSITSTIFERANANGESISGGLGLAAGLTIVSATAGGSTTTQVGGALTSTGTVTVSTTLDSASIATGRAVGASFGAALEGLDDHRHHDPDRPHDRRGLGRRARPRAGDLDRHLGRERDRRRLQRLARRDGSCGLR